MRIPRPKLTSVLICTVLFLFFLLVLFPFQNLKGYLFSQIYQNTRILISAEEIYLSLFGWPGVGMKNVEVSVPMGPGDLELSAKKVVCRVGIGSFWPPAPSVSLSLSGLKGGGDLWLKITRAGSVTKGSIEAEKVILEQLKFPSLPEPVHGTANISGDFSFDEAAFNKSSANLDIDVKKFRYPAQNLQGFVLPEFNLATLFAQIRTRNGNIEISKSQLGEPKGDIQGRIAGELRLAQTLNQSFLNLGVYLQLSEKYRNDPNSATVTSFLSTFQRAPGDYGLKWAATLYDMQTNLFKALPQKATD